MSYKSKQERRRKRIAVRQARQVHAAVIRTRYYLTLVKRDCRCAACGRRLRGRRDEMVYSKAGAYGASSSSSSVTLCVPCSDADPLINYRTSFRWEQLRKRGGTLPFDEHGTASAKG